MYIVFDLKMQIYFVSCFLYRINREKMEIFLLEVFLLPGRDLQYLASNTTAVWRELLAKGLCEGTSPSYKVTEASDFKAFHVLDSLAEAVMGRMGLGICWSTQIVVASSQSCSCYSCLDLMCGNGFNLSNSLPPCITTLCNSWRRQRNCLNSTLGPLYIML